MGIGGVVFAEEAGRMVEMIERGLSGKGYVSRAKGAEQKGEGGTGYGPFVEVFGLVSSYLERRVLKGRKRGFAVWFW